MNARDYDVFDTLLMNAQHALCIALQTFTPPEDSADHALCTRVLVLERALQDVRNQARVRSADVERLTHDR